MKRTIDIESWNRKEHYSLFRALDDPFFGVTVNIDFSNVYKLAKQNNASFFLYSLYKIMQAVNSVEEFCYRIEDESVVCYDVIHPTSTIGRADGTFSFSFFEYNHDLDIFVGNGTEAIAKVKSTSGIGVTPDTDRADVIHYSPVPFIQFTDMKHAMSFGNNRGIPKISTGKYFNYEHKIMLPVSITVNHALMDGLHVAKFIDELQSFIYSCEIEN